MKSKWIGVARFAIVILILVLFMNCLSLFIEIRRDVLYGSRSYGLSTLNDYFDEGRYQQIYDGAISNKYADDKLAVDASQYEAFGRYYHAYTLARINEDNKMTNQHKTWNTKNNLKSKEQKIYKNI